MGNGTCAHMLSDGGCKIEPSNPSLSGGNPGRPEGDIVIEKSVGQGGANKFVDVWNIQYGLDQVAPIDGGPNPSLVIDGKCGPKTIKAIQDFQRKHFGWQGCDGRIDPGKQTIKKLNEKRNRNVFPSIPLNLKTDDFLLLGMLQHVPFTKNCVMAAMAKISSAQIGGLFGTDAMHLINKHFRLDASNRPTSQMLSEIYDKYNSMLSILNRPEAYCTLDTTNEGETISTVAFARLGGFFDKNDLTGKIVFRRGAYFATLSQDFAAFVFIHEMRHYVERGNDVGHHGKGWFSDPGMQKMNTQQRLGNCDTYAGFALEAHNGEMDRPGWLKSTVFR